jgi:hypothetical protein
MEIFEFVSLRSCLRTTMKAVACVSYPLSESAGLEPRFQYAPY